MTSAPGPSTPETPSGRSRKRRLVRIAAVMLVLALGCLFIVARSGIARYAVLPEIASNLHADIQADRVVVNLDGSIVLRNARFTIPDAEGVASRFFEVRRAQVWLSWGGVLAGSPRVTRVELDSPHLYVSQSKTTGRLNIADVTLLGLGGETESKGFTLPTLVARSGVIELGEHDGSDYTRLRMLPFAGRLEPHVINSEPGYSFHVQQVRDAASPAQQPIELSGRIDANGIDLMLHGANLEDWSAEQMPSIYRDVYRRLDLAGRVRPTTFHMSPDGSVRATLSLDRVAINLPFDKNGNYTPEGKPVRMTDTSGQITFDRDKVKAELRGVLDTLSYRVRIDYLGTRLDSPFITVLDTSFRLEEDMNVLLFAPDEVIDKLDMFSNPTADVEAEIIVARSESQGDESAPLDIYGEVNISGGTAAFADFPYPFENISAKATFDRQTLEITGITGVSPAGARMNASAMFSPLGDTSGADIDIAIQDVPIDDTLMAALNDDRRALVDALFNKDRYEQLIAGGLLARGPTEPSTSPPTFQLGGRCEVSISLARPEGVDSDWTKRVQVDMPEGGVLPEHFPLPMLATGVRLEITDEHAILTGGDYRPLRGGQATIEAFIDLTDADSRVPTISIRGRDVPIDDLALNAIPGVSASEGVLAREQDTPGSLDEIINRLNLVGVVDTWADIAPREDGTLGYDIETSVDRVSAFPTSIDPALPELELGISTGTIYVREDFILVNLDADARPIVEADDPGPTPSTPVSLFTLIELPPGDSWGKTDARPTLDATATATALNPDVPLEHFAGVFSNDAALAMLDLNRTHRPRGTVEVSAHVGGELGGAVEPRISIGPIDRLEGVVRGRTLLLRDGEGAIVIDAGEAPAIVADGLRATLELEGEPSGQIAISGRLPLQRDAERVVPRSADSLTVSLRDGRVNSPLSRALVSEILGEGVLALADKHRPDGAYDLDLVLTPDQRKPPREGARIAMPPLALAGSLHPRSLSFDTDTGRVEIDRISGRFALSENGGRIEGLEASEPDWTLRMNGAWDKLALGGLNLQADASLDASGLPPDVVALLPAPARSILRELGISVADSGGLAATDLRLSLTRTSEGSPLSFDLSGDVGVTDASANVGLDISDANGRVEFEVHSFEGEEPEFRIDVFGDRLRAGGIRLTNAHARFRSGDETGRVLVPVIAADVHGGRLAGAAQILETPPATPGAPTTRRYWADVQLSRARTAPLLEDFGVRDEHVTVVDWSEGEDTSRGVIDASLSISATMGDPSTRTGRGSIIASGGEVIELPLLLQLIEFSNLQAPLGRKLDNAHADFFVQGDLVTFETISVFSPAVELFGYGTMRWPASDLDLVFRSQAARPVPFLSDIVEGIRDELVTTRVRGTPPDLRINAEQFRGAKGVVRSLFGPGDNEQQRRLQRIEQQARAEHARARSDARRVASALDVPDAEGKRLLPGSRGFDHMDGGQDAPTFAVEPTDPPVGERP